MSDHKKTPERLSLKQVRRIWSLFFMTLFCTLMILADFSRMQGYEIGLFLQIDPLVWLSGLLTGWSVYKGLALAVLLIIPTLFFGRFFCSWICPLGIASQWLSKLLLPRRPAEENAINEYRTTYRFKYYLLTALIVLALFGSMQIGLFDPIVTFYRGVIISLFPALNSVTGEFYKTTPIFLGGALIGFMFLAILFANRFITRFWCRLICPLGALLGVMSIGSVMRIRRDVEKCTDCAKCLRSCQGACDPHAALRVTECHVCMNCIDDCPEEALRYGLPDGQSSVHTPLDVNRRRILETAAATAIFYPVLKTSFGSATEAQAAVIRPPGSLAEEDFLRRCIKCALCMRVCPTNALHPALLEAGIEGLWTPIMVNKIGYCEHHCTLCGQACPTGAIRNISVTEKVGDAKHPPIKLGTAFYDRGRCLPWAMDVECIVCEEMCPTTPKAIWYQEVAVIRRDGSVKKLKRPFVEPTKCIGCGICENKCPVADLPAVRVSSVGESRSKTNKMILPGKKMGK
jgi:polyferredoxin